VAAERQVFLDGVSKRFGTTTAVDDVTLEVRRGEFLAILGPSGSGKTTTMRIIGGFVRPRGLHVVVGLAALGRTLADLGVPVQVGEGLETALATVARGVEVEAR
jgi:ABC-type Fe3+/spermidine/putrescine transport system ATPase subunit